MRFKISPPQHGLIRALKSISAQDKGVVAVEFALILPFLLLILMGVIELSHGLQAKRKLLNAVQTASDLISQQTDITSTDLDSIYLAAHLTMNPLNTTGMTIGVASVRFDDATGTPTLDWADSSNGGTVVDPLIKADGRGEAGASIVIVTGHYTYRPLVRLIVPVDFTMTETSYVRPRKVSYVLKY
ncbi:MAG: hypothetical protein COB59_07340 [Rhodospirillaceae bacterium]|nr:MAG: hypothetical protein COB59_07340 [Rhodospirillaceae bacterium]